MRELNTEITPYGIVLLDDNDPAFQAGPFDKMNEARAYLDGYAQAIYDGGE